jgi:cell division protease FtsH
VNKLVTTGYGKAKEILGDKAEALVRIAEALLEREVLDGAEVRILIDGGTLKPVDRPKSTDDGRTTPGATVRPDNPVRLPGLEGQPPLPA